MGEISNGTFYFFDTIYLLRTEGALTMHPVFVRPTPDECDYVKTFLRKEFEEEKIEYPEENIQFDEDVALWSALLLFNAAQLLLLRDKGDAHVTEIISLPYDRLTTDQQLSADLCLRFLPNVINLAEQIDDYDILIPLLDEVLSMAYYAGVSRNSITFPEHWKSDIEQSKAFKLLLLERLIEDKRIHGIPEELKVLLTIHLPNE